MPIICSTDPFIRFRSGKAAADDSLGVGAERRPGNERRRILLEQLMLVTFNLKTEDDLFRIGLSRLAGGWN